MKHALDYNQWLLNQQGKAFADGKPAEFRMAYQIYTGNLI